MNTAGYVRCCQCGTKKAVKGRTAHNNWICQDCRKLNIVYERRRRSIYRTRTQDAYTIVDCYGDFRKGAFFSGEETRDMLKLGYFPPGTILEQYKHRYMVAGAELMPQELVRLDV